MAFQMPDKDEQVKGEIILHAQRLFEKYGIEKTTMEDIAKACGKGKSTLYYYYKSKNEIFEAVIHNEIKNFNIESQTLANEQATATEQLRTYLFYRLQILEKHKNLFNILIGQLKNSQTSCFDGFRKQSDEESIQFLASILKKGFDNGEFPGLKDKNLEIVAYLLINTVGIIKFDIMCGRLAYNQTALWNHILDIHLQSFQTQPTS